MYWQGWGIPLKNAFVLLILVASLFFYSQHGLTLAATTTLNAVINPGTLTISNPQVASISAVTLEGTSQISSGSLGDFSVVDNRGSGAGWSVTVSVSDFTCCSPTKTIEVSNLTINPGSLAVISGKSSGVSSGGARSFTSTKDSTTLMSAVSGAGLGSYKVSPTITLAIPADAYAGTYTATLTVTVI